MKKIVCLAAALCSSAMMLFAEDARTVVTQCTFTGFKDAFKTGMVWDYEGKETIGAAFVAAEENAPYHVESQMANLYKIEGENWNDVDANGTVLTEGTYVYIVQLRIDGAYGTTHKFMDNVDDVKIIVDGVEWKNTGGWVDDTYSVCNMMSPKFVLEHVDLPLQFTGVFSLSYDVNYLNQAIAEKDLKEYTTGGTGTYTYAKLTNHVAWLSVSEAGIISGTPTALDENYYYDTIRVTDGADADTLSLYVGPVYPATADREVVSEMTFTGFVAPKVGDVLDTYAVLSAVQPAEGAPYHFEVGMSHFYKKNGENEDRLEDGFVFTEGDYAVQVQIRIDGQKGYYYVLGNGVTMTVDGNSWGKDDAPAIGDNYSYTNGFYEFSISETTAIDTISAAAAKSQKRMVDGQLLLEKNGKTFNAQGVEVKEF